MATALTPDLLARKMALAQDDPTLAVGPQGGTPGGQFGALTPTPGLVSPDAFGSTPAFQPFTGSQDILQMAPDGLGGSQSPAGGTGAQFLPGGVQTLPAGNVGGQYGSILPSTSTPPAGGSVGPIEGGFANMQPGVTPFGADANMGLPPQPLGQPAAGSASTFGPNQNLIGTQFSPTADPRLAATQGQVTGLQNQVAQGGGQIPGIGQAQGFLNQAAGQLGQAQLGPLQGMGADVGQARQQTLGALQQLGSAPNRQQLAQDLYNSLDKQATAQTGQQIRDLGENAAAYGRLGSGMVTSQAGDIFGQREANLAAIRAQLAAQTGGQVEGDLLNRVGAAQGVTQGLGGLDLAQSGLGLQAGQAGANLALNKAQGLAGLGGQQLGLGQSQLGAQQGVLGQLAGLEGQQYGQNMGNLGFQQQERGYQSGLSQQAYQNALQAAGLTQPNTLQNLIASQYGQQGQDQMAGAGNTLAQLFGLGG